MELSEIAAITGLPGLYKIAARRTDGLIVTSLVDDKSQFAPSRKHLFTTLDSITMYTTDEPVELREVLANVKAKEATVPVPDGKDDAKIKAWMEAVLPNYDKEKVYVSDMKKLAKWYGILTAKGLLDELLAPKTEEAAEVVAEEEVAETKGKKTKATKEDKPKKETKPKVSKADKAGGKASTKPAPGAKKVTAPRKAQ